MRVIDRYTSFQGSGAMLGVQQHFVRLAGCSVSCPIRKVCDEPQALRHDDGEDISIDEILHGAGLAPWIHLSGGEPLEQLPQVFELAQLRRVHIQTSGTIAVPWMKRAYITCSPKVTADRLALGKCDELIVVAAPWVNSGMLNDFRKKFPNVPRFLMPLWGEETTNCRRLMSEARDEWRLTIQAHKYWGLR